MTALKHLAKARAARWHLGRHLPGTAGIPDLTGGVWPAMCNARGHFTLPGRRYAVASCTRRAAHTGRHAAGDGTSVIAVWGDGR